MTKEHQSHATQAETISHRAARLIVCETEPRWSPAIRRALCLWAESLVECRGLAECSGLLARWPASLVAVELSGDRFGETLAWLSRLERRHPKARAVVLGLPEATELRAVLLEAGALCLVDSPRRLEELAELARRHWENLPHSPVSVTEQTLAELPWGSGAEQSTYHTHGEAEDTAPSPNLERRQV